MEDKRNNLNQGEEIFDKFGFGNDDSNYLIDKVEDDKLDNIKDPSKDLMEIKYIKEGSEPLNTTKESKVLTKKTIIIDPRDRKENIENDFKIISDIKDTKIDPKTYKEDKMTYKMKDQYVSPDYELSDNRFLKKENKVSQFEKDYFKAYEGYRNRPIEEKVKLNVKKSRKLPIIRTGLTLGGLAVIGFILKGDD